ncbi:flippase [Vibrio metschnikovii]|nr:flippase [Vibrio metschnikovii]
MFDKIILKNITSLFGIQIASYIIPLITLPYLIRVLGVEGYGYLGFSLAIIQYALLFINYGFDLSATNSIAKVKNDKKKVSEIFWNILCIRVLACAVSFVFILLLAIISETVKDIFPILQATIVLVLGTAIFPQWLFQGKEQLGLVSVVRVFAQSLSVPLLFFLVNSKDDIWVATVIGGLPTMVVAIYSLYLIKKRKWVVYVRPSWMVIKLQLHDGWHVFISTTAISLYTTGVTVILGFISGPISVGYFVAAEKLIKAVLGLYNTISRAFYPRVSSMVEASKDQAKDLVFKLGRLLVAIALVCSVFVFVLADFGVSLIFGSNHDTTADILKIFSILPVVVSLSNVFGVQILIPFGFKREFSKILLISGLASLLILFPMVLLYDEYGAAISVVITELLVTVLMIYTVIKLRIMKV